MIKSKSGFTIVELLIVIVVIGILSTITVVAYNGVQQRTRDSVRHADAKAIIKALELYKVDFGTYPPTSASPTANGCSGNGYSYSWATDGSWMKPLVDGGYLKGAPIPPINDCNRNYAYLHPNASSYGCTARTTGYYVLVINQTDGTFVPSDASSTPTSTWKPCPEATAAWGGSKFYWAFTKDDV
jgi:prepilin-type N-terminal cleavage/methylation domain-containing protein